jgi:hypothetical protein
MSSSALFFFFAALPGSGREVVSPAVKLLQPRSLARGVERVSRTVLMAASSLSDVMRNAPRVYGCNTTTK